MGSSAQGQNFSNVLASNPMTAPGGAFAPVTSANAQQAVQQSQGNPAAAWALPMRALFGMLARPAPSTPAQPQPQPAQVPANFYTPWNASASFPMRNNVQPQIPALNLSNQSMLGGQTAPASNYAAPALGQTTAPVSGNVTAPNVSKLV